MTSRYSRESYISYYHNVTYYIQEGDKERGFWAPVPHINLFIYDVSRSNNAIKKRKEAFTDASSCLPSVAQYSTAAQVY